ncbi:unnamed protein product [Miscanthus lutarioriparius]|uniref:Disease resistance R13L4/SHOC-2-like LRR domain-containing protein n=1 Tax=Miscanthus lutarioriparius TaxID=422564 RepID=A0A811Q7L3_9POAL|nr:unnamed protein product [Miscanthus lutarioriparius]
MARPQRLHVVALAHRALQASAIDKGVGSATTGTQGRTQEAQKSYIITTIRDSSCPVDSSNLLDNNLAFDFSVSISHSINRTAKEELIVWSEKCGRVRCQMHDLVHDLARSILGNEISLVPKEATMLSKSYRYFSLINQPRNIRPKSIFGKARALYVDESDIAIFGKELKNAKHLRSITMESLSTKSVPTAILHVKNLRYLSISHENFDTLPEAISDVWSLQALHVTVCRYLIKLPESIGKLQKLRTLNLSGCDSPMNLPDSVGDCHMISSLDLSIARRFQCCRTQ